MSDIAFRATATPLILAYQLRSSPAHIGFWCPWCRCIHVHGAAGGDGNRCAHCHAKSSPFFGHGYDMLFAGTVRSGRMIPQMSAQEMIALSNHLSGVGGDYFPWRPLLDAAGNAIAKRRISGP
jgi:hypothetical protein